MISFKKKLDGNSRAIADSARGWIVAHKEISFFCAAAIISLAVGGAKTAWSADAPAKDAPALESFDTFIPAGFSLVPIEVGNYETLDSLLGPFGVVDLFAAEPGKPESSKCIAYRVKILRAPRNPSHFAVLVPMEQVQKILKYSGPFFVSVQNPKVRGTGFEKEKVKRRSRIFFNSGD